MSANAIHWPRADRIRAAGCAALIARAGERDSLQWWDDDALTTNGDYVLPRLFPRRPKQVALKMAWRSALEKHRGVIESTGVRRFTTIFDVAEAEIESVTPLSRAFGEPIPSVDELRRHLEAFLPNIGDATPPKPYGAGLIDLTESADSPSNALLNLVAAYLLGDKAQPVFPFLSKGASL